jgi:hypothetical protein
MHKTTRKTTVKKIVNNPKKKQAEQAQERTTSCDQARRRARSEQSEEEQNRIDENRAISQRIDELRMQGLNKETSDSSCIPYVQRRRADSQVSITSEQSARSQRKT